VAERRRRRRRQRQPLRLWPTAEAQAAFDERIVKALSKLTAKTTTPASNSLGSNFDDDDDDRDVAVSAGILMNAIFS